MKIFIFLICGLFGSDSLWAQTTTSICTTTCSAYTTCTSCVGTCNSCNYSYVPDPQYTNKPVNNLPFEFNYSQSDLNPGNNSCGSTECGTRNCTGSTTDANKTLPASWATGACSLTPNNRIPATLNCRYKDYYCSTYCSKWTSYSCCASYTTTCK